mmetsp:Transcript_4314/g.6032  ORF Transcript_4314/g.6032 Transcript_4314/m.6032 type:complete len:82 (-) Transcript_4314:2365-2610(-)
MINTILSPAKHEINFIQIKSLLASSNLHDKHNLNTNSLNFDMIDNARPLASSILMTTIILALTALKFDFIGNTICLLLQSR